MNRSCHFFVSCALALAALGCGKKTTTPEPTPYVRPFYWSTSTAAYQVEGGLHGTDWHQWEYQPDGGEWPADGGHVAHNDHADDGPDQYRLFDQDAALAQQLGTNAVRMSIEWARLEPTEGTYDPEAIAHYHAVLASLKAHGQVPMVTLQHFTLPTWIHDVNVPTSGVGGWAGRPGDALGQGAIVQKFARFAGDMAKEYGHEVDFWFTLNEPFVLLVATYVNPTSEKFPQEPFDTDCNIPGVNLGLAIRGATNMIYAHAAAYDAIHANDVWDADGDGKAALVGMAHHVRVFVPQSATDPGSKAAAKQLDYVNNDLILNAAIHGDLDLNLDGKYDGPGELQGAPALKGRLDFLGLNYYSVSQVLATTISNSAGVTIKGLPVDDTNPAYDHTDLGWEIFPQGMHDLVTRYWGQYQLPILITENGIADRDDTMRAKFLVDHVQALLQARDEGAQVWGYTYWSLIDNFEWAKGLTPKFGLYGVDRTTKARTPTKGVAAYQAIIQAGKVTPDIVQKYGQ
jgi:beta-glucosidase/6-phospho-beta-glucosidase/beta-galactosidase